LSALFPRSRLFARYNLTYLDEDATADVDAINGAFMMVRAVAMQEVGLLDEDYFMYMEDLDWCFRFKLQATRLADRLPADDDHPSPEGEELAKKQLADGARVLPFHGALLREAP
jgi:hypothetical protein